MQMPNQTNERINVGQCFNLAHNELLHANTAKKDFDQQLKIRTIQLLKIKRELLSKEVG